MCNKDKIAKNSFSNEKKSFYFDLHRCCWRVGVIRRNTNSNLISDQHRKVLQAPVMMDDPRRWLEIVCLVLKKKKTFSAPQTLAIDHRWEETQSADMWLNSPICLCFASRLLFWFIYIVAKTALAILARAMREIASVSVSLSTDAKRFEMKVCVVLVTIFLIAACNGQTHPMAWQREQRDQRVCAVDI